MGTWEAPWILQTPSGSSEFQAYRDETLNSPALVIVGKTELRYQLRCLDNLHAMLKTHGDWKPVGDRYALKRGLRGRFGMYAPVMEVFGLAEVEPNVKNNRIRAKQLAPWQMRLELDT